MTAVPPPERDPAQARKRKSEIVALASGLLAGASFMAALLLRISVSLTGKIIPEELIPASLAENGPTFLAALSLAVFLTGWRHAQRLEKEAQALQDKTQPSAGRH